VAVRTPSLATYIVVLCALVLLTALNFGLSFVAMRGDLRVALALGIAAINASLILVFYMHVLRSPPRTRVVLGFAAFWLFVVLMMLTFADYTTREAIPSMPGH
jgi:caa(3)-type oxidase subunit IV